MTGEVEPKHWASIDPWWETYKQAHQFNKNTSKEQSLDVSAWYKVWDDLGPWWETYSETGHSEVVELQTLFEQSNSLWEESNSSFDVDPLAADLTLDRFPRGPLQPGNEVGWSRWLARVLGPSPELVSSLLGIEISEHPVEVIREEQLSKQDGSIRRPDLLLYYEDSGVSVEVKLGDENYRKTAETAALVERHYSDRDWTHALLLPKRKTGRLESIVDPPVNSRSEGRPQIRWENPGAISVLHWHDVTAAIRSLLCQGDIADDAWAANAYLFCAVAEQQIIDFKAQPLIEQLVSPDNVVDSIRPIQFASTLEEQLTYLETLVNS